MTTQQVLRTRWADYEEVTGDLLEPVDPARDHLFGPQNASVTLLEYGDYQCPYCRQAHGVVRALLQSDEPTIQFAFRHFPLTNVHPRAEPAAEAAEAAAVQGQFWKMHDLLFTRIPSLEDEELLAAARALGLDERRFARDLVERVHAPRVRADFVSGVRSGVNGTPTFFINGVRHNGSFEYPVLLDAVQAAARAGASRR